MKEVDEPHLRTSTSASVRRPPWRLGFCPRMSFVQSRRKSRKQQDLKSQSKKTWKSAVTVLKLLECLAGQQLGL